MNIAFKVVIQTDVFVILLVGATLCGLVYFLGNKVKHANYLEKPSLWVTLSCMLVETVDSMVHESVHDNDLSNKLAPYIGSIMLYIFISNILGLLGFESPTSNFSVTFTLALITWIMIQKTAIRVNKFSGYLKGYFDPHPAFFIMNVFGRIAPLISMPLRLFGNILSGSIILTLIYTFSAYLSSFIPVIGQLNIFGLIIAPVFHAYFDLFSGFIQMFIFITLTIVFVGNELPSE